jgi:hypothetical protein
MANHVAIQLVNVQTLKIVKLLTFKAEDLVVDDRAHKDAFAVEYTAIHDRPPVEAPSKVALLDGDSQINRAITPSPSAHLQLFQPDFSQNYLQLSGT